MGIWDRLGDVIKSYINSGEEKVFDRAYSQRSRSDPDLNAAYEELDDFLHGSPGKSKPKTSEGEKKYVPDDIKKAFEELGLSPDATADECKETYKKLLKIHHPDRHTGHEGNMKKATDKAARVNAAYDRLEKWFKR